MTAKPETVLVTGATGIIGRHAVRRLLDKGLNVVAVARDSFDRVPLACETRRIDLLNREATLSAIKEIKPGALLHLAWITTHGQFWNSLENLTWLASSTILLRAFIKAGGRRVVAAGTCAEYDWSRPFSGRVPETADCIPATLYGQMKHGLHQVLAQYSREVGVSHAWARLFLLYGEDEQAQRLAPSVARALLEGRPAECSSGKQVRDFLDCRDAGTALADLLMSDTEGVVNICSGEAVSIADFVNRIAAIIGRPDLLRLGALPDRQDDPPYLVGNPARLLHEVGFSPVFSLDQGLQNAVGKWRAMI